MASANQLKSQRLEVLAYEPYLQARLLKSLANDRGESFIDVTACHDSSQPQYEAEAETDPKLFPTDIVKTRAVQHTVSTNAQLQQFVNVRQLP